MNNKLCRSHLYSDSLWIPSPFGEGRGEAMPGSPDKPAFGAGYFRSLLSLTVFIMLSATTLFAQTGSLEIKQDVRVDTLIKRYAEVNSKKASIDGYRIQITAGSNRTKVYQVKSEFYTTFPDIKQHIIYQAPNFKLRVGNYRTRLEAYKDLQEILPYFNDAFIIQDELKLSEL